MPNPNNGVWQSWNYTGPHSAFNECRRHAHSLLWAGIRLYAVGHRAGGDMEYLRRGRTAPYSTTLQQDLALAALTSPNGACYIQNGRNFDASRLWNAG